MGILRTLLALSVVAGHCGAILGLKSVGGVISVQTFYIISGFYMSLILSEKYQGAVAGYRLFITNRLLRLLPIYWVVLGITIISSAASWALSGDAMSLSVYKTYFHTLHPTTLLYLFSTQIIVFFQDAAMFVGISPDTGKLFFTSNFRLSDPPVHSFLLIPQAWTLGVEMFFYLMAPLLVRARLRWIILLISLSTLGRIVLSRIGMYQDPWTYRFFPFELSFFLFGRIAYEIYFRIKDIKWPRIVLICLLAFTLAWTLLFDRIALPGIKYAYFSFMVLAIPFLFHLTREWKRDRWIGELSYPIYICHMLVFSWAGRLIQTHEAGNGTLTAFIAIVAAILLIRWVGNPIEAYRQRRISRQTVSVQIGQHLSANTV